MSITGQIFWIIILSLVVASVAWTVTQEEIFREWRDLCKDKSQRCRTILQRKFFYVFTCEYCFSHWIALLVLILSGFRVLFDDWRGYILAFFLLPWIANLWMSLYRLLRVDIKYENILAEDVENNKPK
ncbi:MAG TPA: hypothetical protein VEV84_06075 [Pyrinomonadaceae bacterium]|nr:hypothetical protein [Pyrinomonadaceae bacterium]